MLADSWTRSLLSLPCLNRGVFIGTDHPDALLEQSGGGLIQAQDWAGTVEEGLRILKMLPRMEATAGDLLGGQPTSGSEYDPTEKQREGFLSVLSASEKRAEQTS